MDRSEYLNCISEYWYQGEVMGEAHLACHLALETDPERRYKWATLLQLETETKARLRPFLMHAGVSIAQQDVSQKIAEFAKSYHTKTWRRHMEEIAAITEF